MTSPPTAPPVVDLHNDLLTAVPHQWERRTRDGAELVAGGSALRMLREALPLTDGAVA